MNFAMTVEERLAELEHRVGRHEGTIGTLISWIAQSANSPISQDEAARLLRLLEVEPPKAHA